MHSTPVPPAFSSPSKSLLEFELERVSRQGRLNLQAARAMAEELCGRAARSMPATTFAATLQGELSSDQRATFIPPQVAFERPAWRAS